MSEGHMTENPGSATALTAQNPALDLQCQGGVQVGTAESDLQVRTS